MSETSRKAVALDAALAFKVPPIRIYPEPTPHGHQWRCDIDHAIGHHGIGDSPANALRNAALAWERYENRHA